MYTSPLIGELLRKAFVNALTYAQRQPLTCKLLGPPTIPPDYPGFHALLGRRQIS